MSAAADMSRTMRIDLIPDIPSEPVKDKRRVVVKLTKTGEMPAPPPPAKASRYEELLDSIYDAAVITDLKGTITDANTRAVEFLLWTKEELSGISVGDIISGADTILLNNLCQNLEIQRFTLIQAYCVRKDGSFFPSEIAVNRLRSGSGSLCFFIRDITLRRQAEEMLRTEHNAIQNAANGIAITNLDGVLEYVNPAFASMVDGAKPEELAGASIYEIFDSNDMVEDMFRAVIKENRRWTGEVKAEMPSGRTLALEILATSNRNSDGETAGLVFSISDLSDRRRAEAAVRESERQRVMLESLGAACHHLGQPATVLMANLGLIRAKVGGDDPMLSEMIDGSLVAIRRLGDTLHKLNCVNEYRTTSYMSNVDESSTSSRILDI